MEQQCIRLNMAGFCHADNTQLVLDRFSSIYWFLSPVCYVRDRRLSKDLLGLCNILCRNNMCTHACYFPANILSIYQLTLPKSLLFPFSISMLSKDVSVFAFKHKCIIVHKNQCVNLRTARSVIVTKLLQRLFCSRV